VVLFRCSLDAVFVTICNPLYSDYKSALDLLRSWRNDGPLDKRKEKRGANTVFLERSFSENKKRLFCIMFHAW